MFGGVAIGSLFVGGGVSPYRRSAAPLRAGIMFATGLATTPPLKPSTKLISRFPRFGAVVLNYRSSWLHSVTRQPADAVGWSA
jgi:hypothetical protein